MGWREDIAALPLISITTGDGATYDLKIKFKGGSIDPKTSVYNYAGKIGSKPKRNSTSSPVYDFNLFIPQDEWRQFKNSVSDPSEEWRVKHPIYGDLKGHPTSINWDNVKFGGDVEWNVQFQESIVDDTPQILTDYQGRILTENFVIEEAVVTNFTNKVPSIEELNVFEKFINDLEALYDKVLNNEYINAFYDIRQTLQETVFNSARLMALTNDILNIGSRLTLDGILYPISTRISLMLGQNNVVTAIDENVDTTTSDGNTSDIIAIFKELSGASNMGALAVTVSNPSESQNDVSGFDVTDASDAGGGTDYRYKKDVDATINQTNQLLEDYIDALDAIDIETQGYIPYSPNDELNKLVTDIINLSVQAIKGIAPNAKEEKIHITTKDTVPEILAFELLGSASESNVDEIIDNNDLFGKNTISNSWRNFIVKKNTRIIYYG